MYNKRLGHRSLVASFAVLAVGGWGAPVVSAQATVKLSKETMFITSPLADDGLPNYALAIMERQSAGVTLENNGAILFWQAMGPSGINDEDFELICDALEIDPQSCLPPYDGPRTDAFRQRLIDWLKTRDASLSSAKGAALSQQIVIAITEGKLSAQSVPPVVAWLKANEGRLDSLVESAMRPRFYSPSPSFLKDRSHELSIAQLQDAEQLRSSADALAMRANWRLSNNDPSGAWQDTLAIWRLGSHASQGWTIINSLVSVAIRSQAGNTTLAIVQSPTVPDSVLKQIQADLSAIDQSIDLKETINFGERCLALDTTLRLFRGRLGGLYAQDADALSKLLVFTFDEEMALIAINQWFDQMVAASSKPVGQERLKARLNIFDDLSEFPAKAVGLSALEKDSQLVGGAVARYSLDPLRAGFMAQSRDETQLRLLRVAVQLAIHRSHAGEYPTTLEEIAEGDLSLLNDLYSDGRLVYQRKEDGYLLYSLFENCADDAGSDFSQPIVEGEWITTDDKPHSGDVDKCDLVIRLPLPQLELPIQPAPEDAQP